MQTFLPYPDFEKSASILDRERLGKQRVENLQILTALLEGKGWIHHPATLMWKGYIPLLTQYHYAICDEWDARGYADNCRRKFQELLKKHGYDIDPKPKDFPIWYKNEDFFRGHRSSLLRKDWDHYSDLFERDLPMDLPYIWPVRKPLLKGETHAKA